VTGEPYRHGVPRGQRRLLLVFLTGAAELSGYPACRAAQVSSGVFYPMTARLENAGWVTSHWQPDPPPGAPARRRFYQLTPEGYAGALRVLGLAAGPSPQMYGGIAVPPVHPLPRADRRVLLALASGAPDLPLPVLRRLVSVGLLRITGAIDRLEDARLIDSDPAPGIPGGRAYYLASRPAAMQILGLKDPLGQPSGPLS
jgi:PadR family transcriptional regulator, regulatory protein PadR